MLSCLKEVYEYSNFNPLKRNRIDDLYTTGYSLNLLDYESIPNQTKILNNLNFDQEDEISDEEKIKLMFCDTKETFNFIASCEEGCLTGNFYEGTICPKCKTEVKTITSDVLKFRSMFRIPNRFSAILHPVAYDIFNRWLGSYKNRSRLIDCILLHRNLFPAELKEAGLKFGLQSFYEDFDKYIEFFTTKSKLASRDIIKRSGEVLEFIAKYRDVLFIRNIPILNNTLHVITSQKNTNKKFTDSQAGLIMAMYNSLKELEQMTYIGKRIDTDIRIQKLALIYYKYIDEIIKKKLATKKGFVKQTIFGGRLHNTFRATIVPITTEHDGDELHVPWVIGLRCLKLEILNLLRNRFNHTFREANERYFKSINKYDPIIHQVLNILIEECPFKGLPVLWDRNPSMVPGAIQLLFVTKFKTDVFDKAVGMSQMIVKAPNADLIIFIGPLISNYQMKTSLIAGNS